MKLSDPFQMNDWPIIPLLKLVIALHLVLVGLITLEYLGFSIPVLRQLISFLYIIYIPGMLVLRILGMHNLKSSETLLYSIGSSIAVLMFTGCVMNIVYPFFGIQRPFSTIPMILTISGIILILCILCYIRDKEFAIPHFINIDRKDYPVIFGLLLIPCLSVLGTHLMNVHHNNILLMFMIVVIALVAILIGFDKVIPTKFYPLAIFVLTLSLLFHKSLISMNLWGWDIFHEYYLANLVIENSFWDSTIRANTNAMLSIVSLIPFFSSICDMDPVWVLKIIYPFIFSLVPLGLYVAVKKQTNMKIAFFSMFFFISIFTFYSEMLALARQQIAELFLVLTILVMIDKTMDRRKSLHLLYLFGASIIVSHYGLTWIYLFSLIAVWILLILMENSKIWAFKEIIYSKIRKIVDKSQGNSGQIPVPFRTITLAYVLFFIMFTIFWYITFSSGSVLDSVIAIGERIVTSISDDFMNPEAAQGMSVIVTEATSMLHTITKYLHFVTIFFIIVGLFICVILRDKFKFENEYVAFSEINFLICVGGVTIPYFANALNTTRLYHITLIFLAPFCIIGALIVFSIIFRHFFKGNSYGAISIFFVIFLLFNSGFVDEIATGKSTSIALDHTAIESTTDSELFNDREVSGAQWLDSVHNDLIFVDEIRRNLFKSFGYLYTETLPDNSSKMWGHAYLYLGTYNIMEKQSRTEEHETTATTIMNNDSMSVFLNRNKIFANGGAEVYYK
ncbi:DUF2206 domain-containing protein [Methanogenium organophilum]|uniref:DUF2206 domain-containing protein n=1 Tax=Methanogenium organophilum TaxID=2199 RepID=A0A9X9S3U4_METOG|nr:DUF2206 domain-containing protein [Methanogenium organophilum]WAI01171.1 DUF2206 domain-containing protein [Methanogenium organophilum]